MPARPLARLLALRLPALLALPALTSIIGCSSPSGNELFAKNGISSAASGGAAGSLNAAAGTDSADHQTQTEGGVSDALGGSSSAGSVAATLGGSAGSEQAQGGSSGSGGQTVRTTPIESCDMLDGAVTNEQNGHCYRVSADKVTYAAARDACQAAGGHLLTVTSPEENEFARDLHQDEHWLGASDGFADSMPGVGDYSWVDGEEWAYTDWRGGQPNAVETDCPGHSGGGGCFEHCAYQAKEGDWVDRSCGHTIVSICEWEPESP
jgi:hypothetical protein